jgi:hypothetical protein
MDGCLCRLRVKTLWGIKVNDFATLGARLFMPQLHNFDYAIELALEAINSAHSYENIALIYQNNGINDEAIAWYRISSGSIGNASRSLCS